MIRPGGERSLLIQRIRDDLELTLNAQKRAAGVDFDQKWKSEILTAMRKLTELAPLAADRNIKNAVPKVDDELRSLESLINAIGAYLDNDDATSAQQSDTGNPAQKDARGAQRPKFIPESDLKRIADAVVDLRLIIAGPTPIREIFSLRGHTREVTDVVFSPNGRFVVTGSKDGTAVLWPASDISAVISIAQDELVITPQQRTIAVAPHASVRDSDSQDFANCTLTISLHGPRAANVAKLQIVDSPKIRVMKQQVHFQKGPNAPFKAIARYTRSADGRQLTFTMNQSADAVSVSALVHAVQLDGYGMAAGGTRLQVGFQMTDRSEIPNTQKFRIVRFRDSEQPNSTAPADGSSRDAAIND